MNTPVAQELADLLELIRQRETGQSRTDPQRVAQQHGHAKVEDYMSNLLNQLPKGAVICLQ